MEWVRCFDLEIVHHTFKIYISKVLMGVYQSDSFWSVYSDKFVGYDN